jgi:hypothetical protein
MIFWSKIGTNCPVGTVHAAWTLYKVFKDIRATHYSPLLSSSVQTPLIASYILCPAALITTTHPHTFSKIKKTLDNSDLVRLR